jgi:predicted Zn-dependent protease
VKDSPGSPEAHEDAAEVMLHAGKMKEAEAASQRAVKLAPSSARAALLQAMVLYA